MCCQQASLALLAITVLDLAIDVSLNSSYPDIIIVLSSWEKYGVQVIMKKLCMSPNTPLLSKRAHTPIKLS